MMSRDHKDLENFDIKLFEEIETKTLHPPLSISDQTQSSGRVVWGGVVIFFSLLDFDILNDHGSVIFDGTQLECFEFPEASRSLRSLRSWS
jgi:hypothetical protein